MAEATGAAPVTAPEAWRDGNRPLYERLAGCARLSLTPANYVEARLTPRPADWKPYNLWRGDFEAAFRDRLDLEPDDALPKDFEQEVERRYRHYLDALDGAPMNGANLRRADLSRAFLPGADLRFAQMQGADLGEAQMQGAVLLGARMQDAECKAVGFTGAALRSASLLCNNLEQAQLEGAIGDEETRLPRQAGESLYVWSCWETPPDGFETLMARIEKIPQLLRPGEKSVEVLRDEWLCNGRERLRTGSPAPEPEKAGP